MPRMPLRPTWAREAAWPSRMPQCWRRSSGRWIRSRARSRHTSLGAGHEPSGFRSKAASRHRAGSCRLPFVTPSCANAEIGCYASAIDRSSWRPSHVVANGMLHGLLVLGQTPYRWPVLAVADLMRLNLITEARFAWGFSARLSISPYPLVYLFLLIVTAAPSCVG